jgi:hypothetical protein
MDALSTGSGIFETEADAAVACLQVMFRYSREQDLVKDDAIEEVERTLTSLLSQLRSSQIDSGTKEVILRELESLQFILD